MNYYPFHVGDYIAHTAHLEPMEDLAYRRLLDLYYLREGPLPADVAVTAKLIRMREMSADVEAVLREFFVLTPEGWTHSRCDAEILRMQDKQAKAKASAAASVSARSARKKQADERTLSERSTNAKRALSVRETKVELPTPTPIPTPTPTDGACRNLEVTEGPSAFASDRFGNAKASDKPLLTSPPNAPMITPGNARKTRARRPRKSEHEIDQGDKPTTSAAWSAYAEAFRQRYGVEPVRNAKVNGMLAKLIERIGANDAPHVARWYVGQSRALYVSARHAVDLLLRDCEGLHADWRRGSGITDTEARLMDRTQATGNVFIRLIGETTNG